VFIVVQLGRRVLRQRAKIGLAQPGVRMMGNGRKKRRQSAGR